MIIQSYLSHHPLIGMVIIGGMSCEEISGNRTGKRRQEDLQGQRQSRKELSMSDSVLIIGSWGPHMGGLFPNKGQGANEAGSTRKLREPGGILGMKTPPMWIPTSKLKQLVFSSLANVFYSKRTQKQFPTRHDFIFKQF